MKKIWTVISLCGSLFLSAQLVTLSKVEKSSNNQDKFFYLINPEKQYAEYLGEVEVDGFSADDAEIFSRVYKKAKTIGANSFSLVQVQTIDEKNADFNPEHYRLNLYYTTTVPKEDNIAYLFASGDKSVRIRVDGEKLTLQPRSYIKKVITYGGDNSIVAGNLLGSKVTLAAKEGQPVQYFQVSSFNMKADETGQGGLNIKSGDIIGLERSYANFLSVIYQQQKIN